MTSAGRTNLNVAFEVLTALIKKIPLFWDIMPLTVKRKSTSVSEEHIGPIFRAEE
jgi:hypothetical protein